MTVYYCSTLPNKLPLVASLIAEPRLSAVDHHTFERHHRDLERVR